ncbi:MAG: type I-E CRISPR-associated protein Cse2/CasB [Bacillota bacterium]|nr:type I-E CRISPR-associated protein Cse2/CasB [Bacillota bacterium]
MSTETAQWKQVFLDRLDRLTTGERATLKRSIGLLMKDAKGAALAAFFRIAPTKETEWAIQHEEKMFLFATLRAFHRYPSKNEKCFGSTLRQLKNSDSFDKKVYALLDSSISLDDGELSYRMALLVRMADSAGVSIHWGKLLNDLLYWDHEDRFVQRNWARSYFLAEETNKRGGRDDE